ncbi:TIR domain-containing protein [Candidatus Pacearchaeota archaeon]|nr:TIR domain-containing protein [Candidatus Pacearchaeota archaeon]
MKKIFIGQAVTGHDINSLQKEMEKIYSVLKQKGYSVYSTLEEEGKNIFKKAGDWVIHAFKQIDNHDIFLVIVRTEHRSEGLLMEIGYAISKEKKIVLAINESVKNTYLRDFTKNIIEWKDFEDLLNKLSKLTLK